MKRTKLLFLLKIAVCAAIALTSSSLYAVTASDLYKQGDVVEFRIDKRNQVIGTQRAECLGMREIEGEQLLTFAMKTKSVFERSGRMLDLDVTCEAGYRPSGLPRRYHFELKVMNVTVTSDGVFNEAEYSGRSSRMGVEQPFAFTYEHWPILLDNNFALQWEIAMYQARREPGDSLGAEAMIPQLNQKIPVKIMMLPYEQMNFDGANVRVRVLRIDPVNQIFYIDDSGRLLKAVDKANEITVTRLAAGQSVEIARESIFSLIFERFPGYFLLVVLAAIWFVFYARGHWRAPVVAIVLIAGIGLYWVTLQFLPAIQNAYFGFAINPRSQSMSVYITLLGSALIFALVELIAIAIPTAAGLTIRPAKTLAFAIAVGAACGVGFGVAQAMNLTAFNADGSVQFKVDMIHKFASIGMNAVCGALFGVIIATRQAAAFYLIPIGLKTLFNWEAAFLQKSALTLPQHSVIGLLVAIIGALILWLLSRRMEMPKNLAVRNRTK